MHNQREPSPDDLIVWPDGTQCHRSELSQMTHMSDDYTVLYYGTPEYYAEMLA